MLHWLLQNAFLALGLLGVVWVICRGLGDRPGFAHVLWLLVLVRLVLPEIPGPGSFALSALWNSDGHEENALPAPPRTERRLRSGGPLDRWRDASALVAYGKTLVRTEEAAGDAARVRAERETHTDARTWVDAFPKPRKDEGLATSVPATAIPGTDAPSEGRWSDVVLALWALGALGFLGVQVRRTAGLLRFVRRGARPAPRALRRRVHEVAERLGVRVPRIVVLPSLGSPFVWSFGRATLVWPADERTGRALPPNPTVLAHELTHLARRDHWIAWFEILVGAAAWWNPVYWIARRQLRRYAELACDARVVRVFPAERRSYAEALIASAERHAHGARVLPALAATSTERREFERRLTLIMRSRVPAGFSPAVLVLPLVLALSVLPRWSDARAGGSPPRPELADDVLASLAQDERLRREGAFHFEREDWERAIRAYAPVAANHPDDGETQARLGIALMHAGREREALAAYDRQIACSVRVAAAHYNRACALARLGELDAAREALDQACAVGFHDAGVLRVDPDLAPLRAERERFAALEARVVEAQALQAKVDRAFDEARWQDVIEGAQRLAALQPRCGGVRHVEGFARIVSGDPEGAEVRFREQLALGFLPHFATYNLACAAARQGDAAAAGRWLEEALATGFQDLELVRTDPDLELLHGTEVHAAVVSTLEEQHALRERLEEAARAGRFAELSAGCATVLELAAPGTTAHGWALHQLGRAALRQGDPLAAAGWFARQVQDGYHVAEGLYDIGCAYAALQNVERALAYLGLALDAGFEDRRLLAKDADLANVRSDPAFERLLQRLDDRAILGRFGAASWKHLQEITEAELPGAPDDGRLWHRLGWALLRQGRLERAAAAFTRQAQTGYSRATARYNVACCHALRGDADEAIQWLERAVEAGKITCEQIRDDADLASLREDPRFAAIVARLDADEKK